MLSRAASPVLAFSEMPQRNMESTRGQWQQGPRPPWLPRLAGVQSPAFSGAESDIESSSTECERVSGMRWSWWWWGGVGHEALFCSCMLEEICVSQLIQWIIPRLFTNLFTVCKACMWSLLLPYPLFSLCQSFIKKLETGSLRVLPSPSLLQKRIAEIDQHKEELKIEVSMLDVRGPITDEHNDIFLFRHIKGKLMSFF